MFRQGVDALKIAVAAYEPMLSYLKEKIGGSFPDIKFTYLPIRDPEELLSHFMELRNSLDGLITGGQVITAHIHKICPDYPYLESLDLDALGICQVLLKMAREHPGIDFSRVFFDFVYDDSGHILLSEILGDTGFRHFPLASEGDEPDIISSLQEIPAVLENRYRKLYNGGEIDYVVTRYTFAESILQRNHIPYYHAFPSQEHIHQAVGRLVNRVRLSQREETCPAVVKISLPAPVTDDVQRLKSTRLFELLLLFSRECGGDFIVQDSTQGYEAFTTFRTVLRITDGLSRCGLLHYLSENHMDDVQIGYGVGSDMQEARFGASASQEEATRHGKGYSGYQVFGSKGLLPGYWGGNRRDGSSYYLEISQKTGLSLNTISRLATIEATQPVTSQSLSDRLGVTVRSANRILKQLAENGLAEIKTSPSQNRRGRPEYLYLLKL